jgi:hypothetical protein
MHHVSRFLKELKKCEKHQDLVACVHVHIEAFAVLFPCTQAVCSILKRFPFSKVAQDINLFLHVADPVGKPGADDAALLICRAFLGNATIVRKRTVFLPIAPDQELIDHVVQGYPNQAPTHLKFMRIHYQDPSGTMRVTGGRNRNHEPSTVVMSWPSVKLTNLVLAVQGDGSRRALSAPVDWATLDGIAAALRAHADHSYEKLRFRANDNGSLSLDAASLCGAALLGMAVRRVAFEGFHLSGLSTPAATEEGPLAPLEHLRLVRCSFASNARAGYRGRPIVKLNVEDCTSASLMTERSLSRQSVLGFVVDVSQRHAVRELELACEEVEVCEMRLLCNLLTGHESALQVLRLGRVRLSDESVELCFQELPSMRSLTSLTLAHEAAGEAAGHLFPTVLDGVRRNYRLSSLTGLSFAYSPLVWDTREIQVYVKANAWGRGAVRASAMSPNDPKLRAAAEQAVVRSASSPDPDADTIRFLLLRLFLPAHAGCFRPV